MTADLVLFVGGPSDGQKMRVTGNVVRVLPAPPTSPVVYRAVRLRAGEADYKIMMPDGMESDCIEMLIDGYRRPA